MKTRNSCFLHYNNLFAWSGKSGAFQGPASVRDTETISSFFKFKLTSETSSKHIVLEASEFWTKNSYVLRAQWFD
jgi:hypothetical protein